MLERVFGGNILPECSKFRFSLFASIASTPLFAQACSSTQFCGMCYYYTLVLTTYYIIPYRYVLHTESICCQNKLQNCVAACTSLASPIGLGRPQQFAAHAAIVRTLTAGALDGLGPSWSILRYVIGYVILLPSTSLVTWTLLQYVHIQTKPQPSVLHVHRSSRQLHRHAYHSQESMA